MYQFTTIIHTINTFSGSVPHTKVYLLMYACLHRIDCKAIRNVMVMDHSFIRTSSTLNNAINVIKTVKKVVNPITVYIHRSEKRNSSMLHQVEKIDLCHTIKISE